MLDASRRVIVVGASEDRNRFANKAVRAYLEAGYQVFPVHHSARTCEGIAVSARIALVPEAAGLLLLYVRPEIGLTLIGEAPGKGVKRVFLNPGADSPDLRAKVESLGMVPVSECAIVALGRSPAEFPA